MKYDQLNKNWNADPNSPMPEVSRMEDGVSLSFYLNAYLYDHIDEEAKGAIEFYNVHKYRLGPTNDEGYYRGQFRYTNKQLPWGEFYELTNSQWQKDFPNDEVMVDDSMNKKKLRHFLFFFKDETFECLANDYSYSYLNSVSDLLYEQYPKGYLSHYLSMFTSNFDAPTTENFKTYIELYIQMESVNELVGVKAEIKTIKENQDLDLFLKLANESEMENFGKDQLNEMIKVIENYKIKNWKLIDTFDCNTKGCTYSNDR